MIRWMSCSLIPAIIALAGCTGLQSQPHAFSGKIPVTEVFNSSQCRMSDSQASAVWSRRLERLEKWDPFLVEKLHAAHPAGIPWNPDSDGMLVIYMGRQPTGGYGLALTEPNAQVRQGVAVVQIQWQRPLVGAIVPQVISSPCLVLTIPQEGLRLIKIQDQGGTVRAEVAVRE